MSREKYAQLAPLTLAIGSALAVSSTQAAVLTVDTLADPGTVTECSLRSAITAVNSQAAVDGCPDPSDPADDVIQFANDVTGVIALDGTVLEITETMSITGPGAGELAVDGQGNSSVFSVSGGQAEISGLTISNGDSKYGGGVFVVGQTNLQLSDCVISGNSASTAGGGIFSSAESLVVDNCDIIGNYSAAFGGGVAVLGGEATIQNSIVASNTSAEIGGGLWVEALETGMVGPVQERPEKDGRSVQRGLISGPPLLNIVDSEISGNTSVLGGGVGAGRYPTVIAGFGNAQQRPSGRGSAANLTVEGSIISGNTADFGGGIGMNGYLDFDSGPNGTTLPFRYNQAVVLGSTISGNQAYDSGGGVASRTSDLTLYLSSVQDNMATISGGGIYSSGTALIPLSNPTSERGADSPGLIYLLESSVVGNEVEGLILRGGGGPGGSGGGIASTNTPVISVNSQISENVSPGDAGGILAVNDNVILFGSEVSGNIGGGVTAYGGSFSSVGSHFSGNSGGAVGGVSCISVSECDFKYSSVSENQGFGIGGIAADYDNFGPLTEPSAIFAAVGRGVMPPPEPTNLSVFNSTVSTNEGAGVAGGIWAQNLSLEHATVAFNLKVPGELNRGVLAAGGVVTDQANSVITHSIIAGNSTTAGQDDLVVTGGDITMNYSLIGSDNGFAPVGSGNLLDTDPQLEPLALNGAVMTLTHAIQADSPAFNAGNPGLIAPDQDQRGPDFPRVVAGVIDIGAYELLIDSIFADRFESTPP